ncbi:MAG: hypothetical protein JSV21_07780 [Nitrospirota bacterium]|nr:MAG: hypothetical protein JSV21_07780 [Nitrospirota bacterium]
MGSSIDIHYEFVFENGDKKSFTVRLSEKDLSFISDPDKEPALWAKLGLNQCKVCTLKADKKTYCPIAANLSDIVWEFKDFLSYQEVSVKVTSPERSYSKDTTVQEGLSSLIGIVMVTSGCPVMDQLKPVVRFHLPFATMEETVFRMVSMYLLSQYFRKMDGRLADWDLEGLNKIYGNVGQLNRDFAERLTVAANKDANVNALVNLDCFAAGIPMTADEMLDKIKNYFTSY